MAAAPMPYTGQSGRKRRHFAILFPGMGHTCKDNFCAKTQETVKKKIPDQVHFITNIQFGQSVEKHTGKERKLRKISC